MRKVVEVAGMSLHDPCPWAGGEGKTIGLALLTPTIIYVKRVLALHEKVGLKGVVHITGAPLAWCMR